MTLESTLLVGVVLGVLLFAYNWHGAVRESKRKVLLLKEKEDRQVLRRKIREAQILTRKDVVFIYDGERLHTLRIPKTKPREELVKELEQRLGNNCKIF